MKSLIALAVALGLLACASQAWARLPVKKVTGNDLQAFALVIVAKGYNCKGGAHHGYYYGEDHYGRMCFCITCNNGLHYRVKLKGKTFLAIPSNESDCGF